MSAHCCIGIQELPIPTILFVQAIHLPHVLASEPLNNIKVGLIPARGGCDLGPGELGQRMKEEAVDDQADVVNHKGPEHDAVHRERHRLYSATLEYLAGNERSKVDARS